MLKLLTRLRKKEIIFIIISTLFILLQVGLDLKLPEYMSNITVLVQTPSSSMHDILNQGLYMLLCITGSLITSVIVGFLASHISSGFAKNIREEMFNKVFSFGMNEIKHFSISSLITRTTNDVTHVQRLVAMGLQIGIKAPIMAVWAVLKIINTSLTLSSLTGLAVIISILIMFITMIFVIPKFKLMQTLTDRLNCVSREGLLGIRVVRAYNAEQFQENKFNEVNTDLTNVGKFTGKTMAILWPLVSFLNHALTLSIYLVGAFLIEQAVIDMKLELFSNIIVFSSYSSQVLAAFMMLCGSIVMYPRVSVSSNRILEVLQMPTSVNDGNYVGQQVEQGKIEFKNVSFKYPGSDAYILKDITFVANQGETIAFVGATGSGKSTLLNLIPRFYDVTTGEILINNRNVQDYSKQDLNSKIGYVPQKAVLMGGSIKDNVSYGTKYKTKPSDEDVQIAIKIAQAEEFVLNMDAKYDAEITRGGTNVSGGQMQRLQIARAVARNPEFYIFDDSFSALDYKTDAKLRKALREHTSNNTTLIVAQRINTIRHADKIIVLDNGRMVGMGTHNHLLDNCETYRALAEAQLKQEELYNA